MLEKAIKYEKKFQKEKELLELKKEKKLLELEQYLPEIRELEKLIEVYQKYDKEPKKVEYKLANKVENLKKMYWEENFPVPKELEKYRYLEKILQEEKLDQFRKEQKKYKPLEKVPKKKLEIDYEIIKSNACVIFPFVVLSLLLIYAFIFAEPIEQPIDYPLFP